MTDVDLPGEALVVFLEAWYGGKMETPEGRTAAIDALRDVLSATPGTRHDVPGTCTACGQVQSHGYHRKRGRTWEPPYHPFYPQPATPQPGGSEPVEGLAEQVRRWLTDEDWLGHAEAATPDALMGSGYRHLGRCAYDDQPWPCRHQRTVDAILVRLQAESAGEPGK